MDDDLLASHVDAIYAVAREDFTVERDRRAKQLREQGNREEAAALRTHRKPTLPAWVVNQLARRHPDEVRALIEAADQLRDLQRRAASGQGGGGLREATQQVRGHVSGLREHARALLEETGSRPDAHLDEVGTTLFAAAVDPDRHDPLRRGVFEAVLAGAGFGAADGLMLVGGTDVERRQPTETAAIDAAGSTRPAEPGTRDDTAAEEERRRRAEQEQRREAELRRAARRRELEQRQGQLERARERQQRRTVRAETTLAQLNARVADATADADEQRAALAALHEQLVDVQQELRSLDP